MNRIGENETTTSRRDELKDSIPPTVVRCAYMPFRARLRAYCTGIGIVAGRHRKKAVRADISSHGHQNECLLQGKDKQLSIRLPT